MQSLEAHFDWRTPCTEAAIRAFNWPKDYVNEKNQKLNI